MPETLPPARIMSGVIPYLTIPDPAAAAAFYQRAFGAVEHRRETAPGDTRIVHLHLEINGGSLMLSDEFPEMGRVFTPEMSVTMQIVTDEIDVWWNRATAAGCTVTSPLKKMFWGDRYGAVKDPFGVDWAFNEAAG